MFIVNGVSGALLHCINFRVATDPACGTGAFLLAAYSHLRVERLTGLENDESLVIACQLRNLFSPEKGIEVKKSVIYPKLERMGYDLVLANPPFGRPFSKTAISGEERYGNDSDPYRCFIRELLNAIRPGGYGCFIVPDSFLFSTHQEAVLLREDLMKYFSLEGVIKLPSLVFFPQTAVQASVLMLSCPKEISSGSAATEMVCFLDLSEIFPIRPGKRTELHADGVHEWVTDWKRRRQYEREWIHALETGPVVENIKGVRIPLHRPKSNLFFANFHQIQALDYSLSMSNYQLNEAVEFSTEEPSDILCELMEMEREFMTHMKAILRESEADV